MMRDELEKLVAPEIVKQILATEQERIALTVEKEAGLGLTVSKAGGRGYLPKTMDYPRNKDGGLLSLLAQVNFAEMPDLADFPTTGLLAFYIDYLDDLTGLDFDDQTKQNGFRVLYFETMDADSYSEEEQDALFEAVSDEFYPVVDGVFRLRGEITKQLILEESYDFERAYGATFYEVTDKWTNEDSAKFDKLYELVSSSSSQLGGSPFFTQEDPRLGEETAHHDTLLFQLDSGDEIMWGDMGVGNFFIHRENLKQRNFTNVMYNWDCY
ncbi:YwqG family protein [Listeria booriae]|uniref:YwqG family protein n=1 Tax=Listeria booriae TaxID=1552123 RepID=UPI0021ADDE53|nr:YwqG family protein [Listeria booriae]